MEKDDHIDQWYSGSKTVLKPLLAYTPEAFELENSFLCSQINQFAADCVQVKVNRGFDRATAALNCRTALVGAEICKSKILCPVETSAFLHTCAAKRNTANSNPQCQKTLAALERCAAASNLSEWWTSPVVRAADLGDQDDLAVLHLRSQRTL